MATDTELTRLADMANALRPDWPARSVRAWLATKHRDRAYADLAVALAAVATDPATTTPGRLDTDGRWWLLSKGVTTPIPNPRASCPLHDDQPAGSRPCPRCVAEAVPTPGLRALRDQALTDQEVPA